MRNPAPGLIHHSDRGSQYCAYAYQKILKAMGAIPSVSGKGNCYDNAVVETFFKTIKSEMIWRTKNIIAFQTIINTDSKTFTGEFINHRKRAELFAIAEPIHHKSITPDMVFL